MRNNKWAMACRGILGLMIVVWIFWETGHFSVTLFALLSLASTESRSILLLVYAARFAKAKQELNTTSEVIRRWKDKELT